MTTPSKHSKAPLKGLFEDRIWKCDCDPRMPAAHLQTKKENNNYGRWFYKCQKPQHTQCKFFLWEDHAKHREESAVLSNSRSEQREIPITRPEISQYRESRDVANPSKVLTFASQPGREKPGNNQADFDDLDLSDLEYSPSPPASQIVLRTTSPPRQPHRPMLPPETPRKTIKTVANTSPGKRRRENSPPAVWPTPGGDDHDEIGNLLMTPITSRNLNRTLFHDPFTESGQQTPQTESRRHLRNEWTNEMITPVTPSRYRDVGLASGGDSSIVIDIFQKLQDSNIELPTEVRTHIKNLLNKHVMQAEGVIKGREISRLSNKAKDAKITELKYTITTLEAEREAKDAKISELNSRILTLEAESETDKVVMSVLRNELRGGP